MAQTFMLVVCSCRIRGGVEREALLLETASLLVLEMEGSALGIILLSVVSDKRINGKIVNFDIF